MPTRNQYRAFFGASLLVLSVFVIGTNFSVASSAPYSKFHEQYELPAEERDALAPPRDSITVVTDNRDGNIVAVNPNGTVLYHNGSHDAYWDVDPSPEGERTVVYTTTDEIYNESICNPVYSDRCARQTIERMNLTTGNVTRLYSRIDPQFGASEWHDADRINGSHYIVADMHNDGVFIVNVSSGIVTWEWNAQSHFPLSGGGPYAKDWTHINDVEILDDGRIMASLRNQDQVVFIDRRRGVIDDWTIGSDDDHEMLYEQHNPDYVPAERGGPAVVIADSENNNIVEYERNSAGEWVQAWEWNDRRLLWPRDADRLSNGHTLVADSLGGRILEIDRQGEIVWILEVPVAYEAERLGTGDESTGSSASAANLKSRSTSNDDEEPSGPIVWVKEGVKGLFPNKVVNAVGNVTPTWMGFYDLGALIAIAFLAVTWVILEMKWSSYTFQKPIVRSERQ